MLNVMTKTGQGMAGCARIGEMVDGNDQNMPEQGKYNGGQKGDVLGVGGLHGAAPRLGRADLARAVLASPSTLVRFGAVVHAVAGAVMIALIMIHVYAAIWVKGTIRAMWYGTVTRAWAKQHHRAWYREMTGK
jgi:formate dehydrogenase subunit gamma